MAQPGSKPTPGPKEIEIFRAGNHTSAAGAAVSFDEWQVSQTAAVYDPGRHEAPLVIGHPKDNAPAYGWVQSLRAEGGALFATPHQVNADFAEGVSSGAFKKRSASFYPPDHAGNPVPGTWYLRHVGFLGAAPPAIKGLRPVEFGEDEAGVVTVEFGEGARDTADFSEATRAVMTQNAAMAAQLAEYKRRDNRAFLHGLVKSGRPLPLMEADMLDFMEHLEGSGTVDFSEADKPALPAADLFKTLLQRIPAAVDFSERAGGAGEAEDGDAGIEANAQRIANFVEAERREGRSISYSAASDKLKAKR